MLTKAELAGFQEDGFFLSRGLFDEEEMALLRTASRSDPAITGKAVCRDDGEGGQSRITLWNQEGNDIFSMFSRCARVVDAMEQILGGEVYHYHTKMMQKEPYTGGAWVWHQDYAYWYLNGCLFPYMASCYIAVDRATRENGCLQVLRGSHLMGRIDHMSVGGQIGADPERVEEAAKRLELVYCEMEPGDALFFHSNTLHRSDQNRSPDPRWGLICCYNAARNDPYKESHHPRYHKLEKVPDSAIKETGLRTLAEQQFLEK